MSIVLAKGPVDFQRERAHPQKMAGLHWLLLNSPHTHRQTSSHSSNSMLAWATGHRRATPVVDSMQAGAVSIDCTTPNTLCDPSNFCSQLRSNGCIPHCQWRIYCSYLSATCFCQDSELLTSGFNKSASQPWTKRWRLRRLMACREQCPVCTHKIPARFWCCDFAHIHHAVSKVAASNLQRGTPSCKQACSAPPMQKMH